MMTDLCDCGKIAVWLYMPSYDGPQRNDFYCDDCVPRGCSCNMEPLDGNHENGDPENGIAPGTAFEDLPDDWVCPLCGIEKEFFVTEE